MSTFFRFFYEFLGKFFLGIWKILEGIFLGFKQIFNFKDYADVIEFYKEDFSGFEWVFVVIAILLVLAFIGLIVWLVVLLVRKYVRFRKTIVEQECFNR